LHIAVEGSDQAIQRAVLFLYTAHIKLIATHVKKQRIYLEVNELDRLCESVHDAKKLDDRRKVRIECVLVLGGRAPARCVGCELFNKGQFK
jgi:hypothetical protein